MLRSGFGGAINRPLAAPCRRGWDLGGQAGQAATYWGSRVSCNACIVSKSWPRQQHIFLVAAAALASHMRVNYGGVGGRGGSWVRARGEPDASDQKSCKSVSVSLSQCSGIILHRLTAPLWKRLPLCLCVCLCVSVSVCVRVPAGGLIPRTPPICEPVGCVWHHQPHLPRFSISPSLLQRVRPIGARGEPVTWTSPIVLVTMTTSTGPGSILPCWEKRGGERRREERQKEKERGGGKTEENKSEPEEHSLPFGSSACVCQLSAPQHSEYFTFVVPLHTLHHRRVNGDSLQPIVIYIWWYDVSDVFLKQISGMTSCVNPLLCWECAGSLTLCRQAAVCRLPLAPIDPQWMADDRAPGWAEAWWEPRCPVQSELVSWCGQTPSDALWAAASHSAPDFPSLLLQGCVPLCFTQVDTVHIPRPLVVCLISKSVQIQLGQLVPIGDLRGGMSRWQQCVLLAPNQVSQNVAVSN